MADIRRVIKGKASKAFDVVRESAPEFCLTVVYGDKREEFLGLVAASVVERDIWFTALDSLVRATGAEVNSNRIAWLRKQFEAAGASKNRRKIRRKKKERKKKQRRGGGCKPSLPCFLLHTFLQTRITMVRCRRRKWWS